MVEAGRTASRGIYQTVLVVANICITSSRDNITSHSNTAKLQDKTLRHHQRTKSETMSTMIDSSVPYHVTSTALQSQYGLDSNNATFDHSMAAMHGPTSTDKANDTKARKNSGYLEDEHFTTLADPIQSAPPVVVFFSFMDSRSHDWAVKHEIVNNIRRNVPQGTSIVRYHAPMRFSWDLGDKLTHSWATAESLHVDDRIIEPMFQAIHEKSVTDFEGIRIVFDQIGIPPMRLLEEWGKTWVLNRKDAMDKAVEHVNLKDVPGILVHGKYMVNLDSFDEFHADQAVDLVKDLLART